MIAGSEAQARSEIAAYFDDFVAAFATFDGGRVAALFAPPAVALRRDGSRVGFATSDEIARYYQAALGRYREQGCDSCRTWDVDITFLNETTANAVVSWDLLDGNGGILSSWRQAYFLTLVGGAWRCYGSAYVWDLRREGRS